MTQAPTLQTMSRETTTPNKRRTYSGYMYRTIRHRAKHFRMLLLICALSVAVEHSKPNLYFRNITVYKSVLKKSQGEKHEKKLPLSDSTRSQTTTKKYSQSGFEKSFAHCSITLIQTAFLHYECRCLGLSSAFRFHPSESEKSPVTDSPIKYFEHVGRLMTNIHLIWLQLE